MQAQGEAKKLTSYTGMPCSVGHSHCCLGYHRHMVVLPLHCAHAAGHTNRLHHHSLERWVFEVLEKAASACSSHLRLCNQSSMAVNVTPCSFGSNRHAASMLTGLMSSVRAMCCRRALSLSRCIELILGLLTVRLSEELSDFFCCCIGFKFIGSKCNRHTPAKPCTPPPLQTPPSTPTSGINHQGMSDLGSATTMMSSHGKYGDEGNVFHYPSPNTSMSGARQWPQQQRPPLPISGSTSPPISPSSTATVASASLPWVPPPVCHAARLTKLHGWWPTSSSALASEANRALCTTRVLLMP